jgi:acyl carrier protein
MTKEEIFHKIQDILVKEFEIDKEAVTPEAKLNDDLELDSIDAVDLMVKMKEYVPKKIDPEQFKKVITIQDVVDMLHPLINNPDGS